VEVEPISTSKTMVFFTACNCNTYNGVYKLGQSLAMVSMYFGMYSKGYIDKIGGGGGGVLGGKLCCQS
jgi:hypothetical protein